MEEYLLPIPLMVIGGIVIWIMTFLGTYPHFPKMEKKKRIALSVTSATVMAVALMITLVIAMYFLMKMVLK